MVVASEIVGKEQTMRRSEGRGENEFRGATEAIWVRISSSDCGWKRRRSWRSVIRRVFDGGVGWDSWGRLLMSRESDGREECEVVDVVELILTVLRVVFLLTALL